MDWRVTAVILCAVALIYLVFLETEQFEQYAIVERHSHKPPTFPDERPHARGPFDGEIEASVGLFDFGTYHPEAWNVHLLCENGKEVVWETDKQTWHRLYDGEKIRIRCMRGRIFRGMYIEGEVS